jgi:hypothetical protein
MVEGKQSREIANELIISMDTVRTHTRGIFSKLDVHSRLEAVSTARAAGLRPRDQATDSGGQAKALSLQKSPPTWAPATTGDEAKFAGRGPTWTSH